jgi:hypothetical protein
VSERTATTSKRERERERRQIELASNGLHTAARRPMGVRRGQICRYDE